MADGEYDMNQAQTMVLAHDINHGVLVNIHDFLSLVAFMEVAAKTVPASAIKRSSNGLDST